MELVKQNTDYSMQSTAAAAAATEFQSGGNKDLLKTHKDLHDL